MNHFTRQQWVNLNLDSQLFDILVDDDRMNKFHQKEIENILNAHYKKMQTRRKWMFAFLFFLGFVVLMFSIVQITIRQ